VQRDKTLREQLQPDDDVVHFVRPIYEEPEGLPKQEALVQAVRVADEVLLAEVDAAETQLISNERWVRTRYCAHVVAVHKAPVGAVQRGDERCFVIGGGQVVINGVKVQVLRPLPYAKGRRYLVLFGQRDDEGLYPIFGAMPLLKVGDTFFAYPGFSEHLSGVTVADVRRAVNAPR